MNTEEGGQKYTLPRDEETKRVREQQTQMRVDKSTHFLEMKRQRGI